MENTYYPDSPKGLTKKFTKIHGSYISKALLAILAIIVFIILYTALIAGFVYLTYYAIIYPIQNINKFTILLKIGAIGGSAMLIAFTLKFLFKIKNFRPTNRLKLSKDEHPKLWDFVYQICKETGAPKPKNIYVDPDVNAYVAYSNTWLSLFLPIKKELTIGLGLTDTLNLSEFKAVISHEFGHFAQKEMKIGSYINSANTIIHDMIYQRDSWDNLLEQWRGSDIRLAAAAWLITPIIWCIRQLLGLFYQFLNLMYSSLSREMEFNADKYAVKTSGTEAMVSSLWKLDQGFETWNKTLNNTYLAIKKKVFVKNLYTHNQIANENQNEQLKNLLENLELDKNGNKIFFPSSETSKVGMYASHPPNDLREKNAGTPYIKCKIEIGSPWILFENATSIQEQMTSLIYKEYFNQQPKEFSTKEVFENFIFQETKGKELQAEYLNTFENRFFYIDDELTNIVDTKKSEPHKTLVQLKDELKKLMEPIKEIEVLMEEAVKISNGTTTLKSLDFQGKSFKKKNISEGYNLLTSERDKLYNDTFKNWDTEFCTLHLNIAHKLGKGNDLLNIYKQHSVISGIYKSIIDTKVHIYKEYDMLQQKGDLEEITIRDFSQKIKKWMESLNDEILKIDTIEFIPMSNIDDAKEFKENIIEKGQFKRRIGNIFETGAFNEILDELENALSHCQRLEQKNIELILMFHKKIQKESGIVG